MAQTAWILLLVLSVSYVSDAYKILVIFPVPGKSHSILGKAVVKHLLNAGHEVTFITSVIDKKPHPKLKQIDVSSNWNFVPESLFDIKTVMDGGADSADNVIAVLLLAQMISTETLRNENVQTFLADQNMHFDLVIAEWMFNELYSGLAAVYNAPLVWVSTVEPHGQVLSLVDEYLNTAYNGFYIDSLPPFSFGDRVIELWQTVKLTVVKETLMRAMQWWHYGKLIAPHIEARGKVPPSLEVLKYNASLMLANSHVSLGEATRLPQSYKPIGGYHVSDKVDPLPENIKKIMDDARDGVIYFSMGSNLKADTLPDELKRDILKVFESLKQTVIWKFETELPNTPKNVHIMSWAPQQSILAHPNCVLFITHGGLLSTTETVHVGVPIIGIPVFADQFVNVNRAVNKGFARKVRLSYTMAGELKTAIEEILSDPKYTQKVKELSYIYHDRPTKPGDELVHWVEHVIKTNGAPHLRSPALMVPWYQKLYLDLFVVLVAVVFVLKKISKLVLPLVFPNRLGVKQKQN